MLALWTKLKTTLVKKVASSFLLKYADGYKTEILQVVNGVKNVLLGFYAVALVVDHYAGTNAVPIIEATWAYVLVGVNFLTDLGMEIAITHSKLKDEAGLPQRPKVLDVRRG